MLCGAGDVRVGEETAVGAREDPGGAGVGLGVGSMKGGGARDACGVTDGSIGPSGEAEKFRNAKMIPAATETTAKMSASS